MAHGRPPQGSALRRRVARPAVWAHLPRPGMHLRGGPADAAGPAYRAGGLGMGDGGVHHFLLSLRDPDRRARRPDRAPAGADPDRRMVVRVHRADGRGHGLRAVAAHPLSVRCGRGGGLSQRVDRRLALVPACPQGHDVRGVAHGEPVGRCTRTVGGSADPEPVRMARVILRVRRVGNRVGRRLARVVPRFAAAERRASARIRGSSRGPCVPLA